MMPDHRAIELGNSVNRITSFPIMPELPPWNLTAWNTAHINTLSGSSAQGGNLPPPKIFSATAQTTVRGLDELNAFLMDSSDAVGGSRITLTVDNGVINLLPLVAHLRSLRKDTANTRRRNDSRKTDAKNPSV